MTVDTSTERIAFLKAKAKEIRKKIIDLTFTAGGGHLGGGLSMVDLCVALYYEHLKFDPKNPAWPERDRFILSKGHGIIGLCPILADVGYFPEEKLSTFNKLDSPFGMHPDMHKVPGVEMSTGSLGHGLSVAVGVALSARLDKTDWRVYCLTGDGELDEGTIWEAVMSAAHFKLGNLVVLVDRNGFSLDGPTEEIMSLEPLAARWGTFGWNATEIDGHNMEEITNTLNELPPTDSDTPTVIIAQTVKGKGVDFMESKPEWHYGGLDDVTAEKAKKSIDAMD